MSGGRNSFSLTVDTAGLDAMLRQLGDDAEAAARPAAQAMAQVLYEQVKLNVQALRRVTGNLDRAIYQAFSASNSSPGRATYHVSWNAKKAPHGWLVENGHLQRYAYYQDDQGRVRPMVRPGMEDKPRPRRRASRAEKEAYYVTLPTPKQVPARSFVRSAYAAKAQDALAAGERVLLAAITKRVTL